MHKIVYSWNKQFYHNFIVVYFKYKKIKHQSNDLILSSCCTVQLTGNSVAFFFKYWILSEDYKLINIFSSMETKDRYKASRFKLTYSLVYSTHQKFVLRSIKDLSTAYILIKYREILAYYLKFNRNPNRFKKAKSKFYLNYLIFYSRSMKFSQRRAI